MSALVPSLAVLSVLCFVAGVTATVLARRSSTRRLGLRVAASLLFPAALILFGIAPLLAAEVERSLRGQISIGAGEGAQFGLFALVVGAIWLGVGVLRLFRRSSQ